MGQITSLAKKHQSHSTTSLERLNRTRGSGLLKETRCPDCSIIYLESRRHDVAMANPSGRPMPLSLPRRVICDLVHFGQKVPAVTVQREMNVAKIWNVRSMSSPRSSWCAIFVKAYAKACMAYPQLRRAYLKFPWPRLFECDEQVASVAVERQFGDEPAVFFAHVRNPHLQSLADLDSYLHRYKTAPIESIGCFRRALLVAKFPRFLRRLLWRITLNCSGAKRAKRLGTFGVSVYSGLGAASLNPISPLTSTLNYDVIKEGGTVLVRVVYDHRVLDGGTVARALAEMEEILNSEILEELSLRGHEVREDQTMDKNVA